MGLDPVPPRSYPHPPNSELLRPSCRALAFSRSLAYPLHGPPMCTRARARAWSGGGGGGGGGTCAIAMGWCAASCLLRVFLKEFAKVLACNASCVFKISCEHETSASSNLDSGELEPVARCAQCSERDQSALVSGSRGCPGFCRCFVVTCPGIVVSSLLAERLFIHRILSTLVKTMFVTRIVRHSFARPPF